MKASGLLTTLLKKSIGEGKKDAFHSNNAWEPADAMTRAHIEMVMLIHFCRNMDHAKAIQNRQFHNKSEPELQHEAVKDEDVASLYSGSSTVFRTAALAAEVTAANDITWYDIQREADTIIAETLKRNAKSTASIRNDFTQVSNAELSYKTRPDVADNLDPCHSLQPKAEISGTSVPQAHPGTHLSPLVSETLTFENNKEYKNVSKAAVIAFHHLGLLDEDGRVEAETAVSHIARLINRWKGTAVCKYFETAQEI